MTTQQPAALWIAYELEIGTFVPNVLQNEIVLRQNAAAELRRQHASITELESQLAQHFDAADMATAAAQGFRDGAAKEQQAGAFQAALDIRTAQGWKLAGDKAPVLYTDEINGQQVCRDDVWLCTTDAFTHHSPSEGMAGWQPIEAAPRDGTEILLYAPACVYEGAPVEARITYGKWLAPSDTPRIKYQDGFAPDLEWDEFDAHWVSWEGGFTPEHPPTHWMPLPAGPGPADGESK